MKKYFLTGLAVILPILLTLFILELLLKLLTAPFYGVTQFIIAALSEAAWLPAFLQTPQFIRFLSQIFLLSSLFFIVVLVGFLGRWFLINALFKLGDRIIHKVPIANKIYKAVQDVMQNLMSQEKPSFSQVVEVPFPHERSLALGFITKDEEPIIEQGNSQAHVSVFIPGTPNPMMGFVVLIPAGKIHKSSLTIEQAVKFIVSCGVISPAASVIGKPNT